ncbi:AMP-binding protein [Ilumatobacter coccineus]|uniref:AMP-dependent synthetase n=1 Tax=Ilumatobacter coccineus (strain NBRC 103263 / KCTC 29153 / YM16-304) TaxID=1313172 RepID=A0A6C7E5K2_ILUCY|nr:AMP-binding protein [Ilumatobacter coccineus]BAN01831.1 hypothetical protein YM304_15170 [Ilumatobacter coccineus YM16-304]
MSELVIDRPHVGDGDERHGRELVDVLGNAALRRHGRRTAVHVGDRSVSYAELARLAAERCTEFGVGRRLVVIGGGNDLDVVVTLLACIEGRHPFVLVEPSAAALAGIESYRPDVVVTCEPDRVGIDHRTDPTVPSPHRFHAELAGLASTSGSTGAAKLVRWSARGLASNAVAIASSLDLRDDDCAITSLPMHYCYGLSVLTSHLVVGARIVLTDNSVVDPCFRHAVVRHGVTTLAGVPYTFDLLERGGGDLLDSPTLRLVTQAGGRLAPAVVSRLAQRGRRSGWDFVVMYGQTEATARMAYLPPDEVEAHPECVGVAIPGGELSIDRSGCDDATATDADVGEIVYRGPNVMMGYATSASDLATGREFDELRTGDLGRINDAGLLEIVGRANRFLKIHGKRIDLDHLEATLQATVGDVRCAGDDELLVVAALRPDPTGEPPATAADLAHAAAQHVAIPAGRIASIVVDEFPRTSSGKIDRPALVAAGRSIDGGPAQPSTDASVAEAFRLVLGVDTVAPDDTFAGLGGDSFSYVEMSIRLEEIIGTVPSDWHVLSVGELDRLVGSKQRRRFVTQLETSVVIRAIGISLIVCTHMRVFRLAGGAHTLLAVLGYNFARFQLTAVDVGARLRSLGSTIARVAVPTSVWIGLNALLFGGYSLGAVLLVNNYTGGAARRDGRWEYWYFETFVQVMIVLGLLFSFARVRHAERRAPFAFALGVLAITWLFRFDVIALGGSYNYLFRTHTVASFVALGWLAYRSTTNVQRLVATAATVATSVGYFGQTDREWRIIVMVTALIWIPRISLPTPVARVVGVMAAASMWTFLVHWQVWPLFTPWLDDRVAYLLTMATGVVVWRVAVLIGRWWNDQRRRRTVGRSTSNQVSTPDTAMSVSDASPVSA